MKIRKAVVGFFRSVARRFKRTRKIPTGSRKTGYFVRIEYPLGGENGYGMAWFRKESRAKAFAEKERRLNSCSVIPASEWNGLASKIQ